MLQADSPALPVLNQSIDEKLFRLLVASVKDYAIFMIDPNGYIMSWNEGAVNIKGYTEEEIIGNHISIFYTVNDNRKNEPRYNLNEALKRGSYESEGWRVRKDGSVFWADIVFTTLYNEKGHLIGFAKVTRDITERKKIENEKEQAKAELQIRVNENTKKIITNEQKFRKLIEHSYGGISLFDENLKIIYRSNSSEEINGWSNTAVEELDAINLVHPADKKQVKHLFKDILSKPRVPIVSAFRTKHKKGHYIWVECLFTNMLDDKSLKAIVCNFRDVTARKNDEEEIRKKTEQVENILESITDGFIALDNNFCYTYLNKKISEMLGYSQEALIGKNVWDVFPDAIGSETYKAFNEAIKDSNIFVTKIITNHWACGRKIIFIPHHQDCLFSSEIYLKRKMRNLNGKKLPPI